MALLSMRDLNDLEIDPNTRTAWAGTGLTAGRGDARGRESRWRLMALAEPRPHRAQ